MKDNKGMKIYHGPATRDRYAEISDKTESWIISAAMKDIKDAYDEFLKELLLESQEAY